MKSHFTFTKKQRNGIFLLVIIIIAVQVGYFLIDASSKPISYNQSEYNEFVKEIDSLRKVEIASRQPKIFPFNPNYISDYKGAILGMSTAEIDRLLAFRKQKQWINSAKQFQDVTKVSDSLLEKIAPYFKFPDWVTNPKPKRTFQTYGQVSKTYDQKLDLNTATALQLKKVNGVGDVLSNRIIKFRNKFVGGFISDIQLKDVYGLSPEVIESIKNHFTVKTPRQVHKINLNTATVDDLVTIQHIDYDLAGSIIEQRVLRGGFSSIDELTKVKGFPANKLDIIELYLWLEKEN